MRRFGQFWDSLSDPHSVLKFIGPGGANSGPGTAEPSRPRVLYFIILYT